jgi:trehalose 6-phosphate synthase/phosphatase
MGLDRDTKMNATSPKSLFEGIFVSEDSEDAFEPKFLNSR